MNVEILNIHLADRLAGKLFRFDNGTSQALIRYVADENFALDKQQDILSLGMRAASPDLQTAYWFDVKRAEFNAQNGRLPVFFQNMLPEGLFRTQLEPCPMRYEPERRPVFPIRNEPEAAI